MAITFVSAASAGADTLSMPSHQAGDLIIFAAHTQGATLPTLPSGWMSRFNSSATSRRQRIAFKVATSSSETSGTWTNAQCVAAAVYRSNSGKYLQVASARSSSATSTSIQYINIINPLDFSTWYIGIACTDIDAAADTPPTGMTNRTSVVNTSELAIHDTNANVSGWGTQNVASVSVVYTAVVLEIFETDIAIASGGGVPLIGTGGLVY